MDKIRRHTIHNGWGETHEYILKYWDVYTEALTGWWWWQCLLLLSIGGGPLGKLGQLHPLTGKEFGHQEQNWEKIKIETIKNASF